MYRYRWLLVSAVVASALITSVTYASVINKPQPPRAVVVPSFNVSYGALTGAGGSVRRGLGVRPLSFRGAILNHGPVAAVVATHVNVSEGFASLNRVLSTARRR